MGEGKAVFGVMNRIASFTVDHRVLEPGVYVSMRQKWGDSIITTIDIRMVAPYHSPVLSTGVIHAIEHIGATYFRNESVLKDRIVYFGPMGCRTGFYLVLFGDFTSEDVLPAVKGCFACIRDFNQHIPGASKRECGNYKDMDLEGAKEAARFFYSQTLEGIDSSHLKYQKWL